MGIQPALLQYLLYHGKLPLSGIGTFYQEEVPARLDFAGKLLHAPTPVLRFALENQAIENRLYDFLAASFQEQPEEAMRRYNDYCYELKQKLTNEPKVLLPGLGTLERAFLNTYSFQPAADARTWLPAVGVERVLRQSSEAAAVERLESLAVPVEIVREKSAAYLWIVLAFTITSIALILLYWMQKMAI